MELITVTILFIIYVILIVLLFANTNSSSELQELNNSIRKVNLEILKKLKEK